RGFAQEPARVDAGRPPPWQGALRHRLRALSRVDGEGRRAGRDPHGCAGNQSDSGRVGRAQRRVPVRDDPERRQRDARLRRRDVRERAVAGGALSASAAARGKAMTTSLRGRAPVVLALLVVAGTVGFALALADGAPGRAWEAFLVNLLF